MIDIQGIKEALPHRYPMLLVDRVLEVSEDTIVAIKNVTINEPFFNGHFPQYPVMPGVLIMEHWRKQLVSWSCQNLKIKENWSFTLVWIRLSSRSKLYQAIN